MMINNADFRHAFLNTIIPYFGEEGVELIYKKYFADLRNVKNYNLSSPGHHYSVEGKDGFVMHTYHNNDLDMRIRSGDYEITLSKHRIKASFGSFEDRDVLRLAVKYVNQFANEKQKSVLMRLILQAENLYFMDDIKSVIKFEYRNFDNNFDIRLIQEYYSPARTL